MIIISYDTKHQCNVHPDNGSSIIFLSDQNLSECLKKEAKWKKKLSQKNILAGLLACPNELNNAEN